MTDTGGFIGGYLGAEEQQRRIALQRLQQQQQQQQLADQQRQLAGRAAMARTLGMPQQVPPPPQQQQAPQPPMPGQPSIPMQPPQPQQQPQMQPQPQRPPMGPPMGGAPGPQGMPPGMGRPPQPGMQQGPMGGAPGGLGAASGPMAILQQIAQQIKRANPGIDDETLADAVGQQIDAMKGVQPEIKDQLNLALQQMKMEFTGQMTDMKLQNARDIANQRSQTTERGQDISQGNTERRVDATERGQDIMSADRLAQREQSALRTQFIQGKIDARAAAAAGNKTLNQQKAAQYKQLTQQFQQIKDRLSDITNGFAQSDQAQTTVLTQQRDQLRERMVQFWSQNNWLPKPSELLTGELPKADAQPDVSRGSSEQGADKPAPSAPPSGQYKVGDTVPGPDGKKYKITGFDKDGTPLGELIQ